MARRLEITLSEESWERLERVRGFEPRASFVKRALEKALGFEVPRPPTEMLDREHLMKTGKARMLPLDPGAASVDEAVVRAREKARVARPAHSSTCKCSVCVPKGKG
jgi:hypothetical protein